MPRISLLSLWSFCSKEKEVESHDKTSLTDSSKLSTDDLEEHKCETQQTNCAKFPCQECVVIIIVLVLLNVTGIVIYICHPDSEIKSNYNSVEENQNVIYLPCINGDITGKSHTVKDFLCKQNSSRAIVNLITLILAEHTGRRNLSIDPAYRDGNRPILKQKFSELYYAEKSNTTQGTLQLHMTKQTKENADDYKTALTVGKDGIYIIYVSLQYCFRKIDPTSGTVSMEIHQHSEQSSSIIYRSSIRIGSGLQTFIPNTCLLPFKLKQNDTLSLHVTDTSSLYEMRVGNVFGIQEVSNDVSV